MVPTVASPSAQPAIVKIRRVDALIIIIILLPAATTTPILLLVFTRWPRYYYLLVDDARAAKYTAIAPSSR